MAIRLRSFAVSASARALPPFNPPSLPNATAAGFFFNFVAMCQACHEPPHD